jgi:hypothetical protein
VTWKKFQKRYLKWFNVESRAKTYAALKRVVPKLPEAAIPDNLIVFAPGLHAGVTFSTVGDEVGKDYIIYLAPTLELESSEEIDFVIAHEFAHIVRNKTQKRFPTEKEEEEATDQLAESWGIKNPPYNYNWWGESK